MNITIIGTGYIGLVQGVIMSDLGYNITCIDNDTDKIETLKVGTPVIYEPELEEILKKNIRNNKIHFTSSYSEGLKDTETVFLSVGTPAAEDGKANLEYIEDASVNIGKNLESDCMIIVKSTVPVGTNRKIKKIIYSELEKRRKKNLKISIVSNPEFLREGKAVYDFLNPDRIVIGIDSEDDKKDIQEKIYNIYSYFHKNNTPIIFTTLETAELSKYASNAFLSVKISFINEMSLLSEKTDANIEDISKIMGYDHRIGKDFLKAGIGFGGSCFPKDTLSILNIGRENDCEMEIINSAVRINENIKNSAIRKIEFNLGSLKDKTISVLGLSFKPGTDDIRESPAIKILKSLIEKGAKIKAYCPKGMENTKDFLKEYSNYIIYSSDEYDCAKNSDAVIIATEWEQFSMIDLEEIHSSMKDNYFFDFRNMFTNNSKIRNYFKYYPIGTN